MSIRDRIEKHLRDLGYDEREAFEAANDVAAFPEIAALDDAREGWLQLQGRGGDYCLIFTDKHGGMRRVLLVDAPEDTS